jgi:predicted 3-demethylubiquinone-9 3-methyltransferase (glyoxalase superfamily)
MSNSIYPCITIKNRVGEAADFYINVFGDGRITNTSQWVVEIDLSGQKFLLLTDGPTATPNSSISFMVTSETAEETEKYWNALIEGGSSLMPLDSYPWSPKYGWLQDKFGVSWQLYTGSRADTPQKFCPTLMFTGSAAGRATEAIHYYTSLFPNSEIQGILKYSPEDGDNTDFVKHAQFRLDGFTLMAMESSMEHAFSFNDAISFVVPCDDQAEIDKYWNQLTSEGGKEVACGWLTDRFGISWQIIPKNFGRLMSNPENGQRAMQAMLKMKKLVIAELESA